MRLTLGEVQMCSKLSGIARVGTGGVPTADDLMREIDLIEVDLGRWLAAQGTKIAARQKVLRVGMDCLKGLNAAAWRALILIWSTSPTARRQYSADSRGGLYSAAETMDDLTLLALVRDLLEQAGPTSGSQQMAA